MKIIVTGSSGLVGSTLVEKLMVRGDDVVRITRTPSPSESTIVLWKPESREILDTGPLEGADAVIHLAGESIAEGHWTLEKKASIRNSRVQGTGLLAQTLTQLNEPPRVFLSASAIGFYGKDRGDDILTEASSQGTGFLAGVCRDWEEATQPAIEAGLRVCTMRIGFILSPDGGGMQKMLPPFKLGLGGPIAGGEHWMSWVAIDDVVGAMMHLLDHDDLSGPFNLVAPSPCRNKTFTKVLGKVLHRPVFLPVPAFGLRMLFGEMADELLLASHRVIPDRLTKSGFEHRFPDLEAALNGIVS